MKNHESGLTGESAPSVSSGRPTLASRRWTPPREPWATMLIVHGIAEHSGRYERTGAAFAAAGIDTHSFDLRGFGASSGRRAYVDRWTDYLDDVEVELARVRADGRPTVLMGHSMGGLIALDYALTDRPPPDLLVLSAPAIAADVPVIQRLAAAILSRILPTIEQPNGLRGGQLSRDPAVGAAYFADPLVHARTTARLGHELFSAMDRVRGSMSRLTLPTLVVQGGDDSIVPESVGTPLGSIPSVRRIVYPGQRHEIFNEPEADRVVGDVVAWLRERLGASVGA